MSIERLDVSDKTGVMRNISLLLEHLRNKNLDAITVVWRTRAEKDVHTFWNGDELTVLGLLYQAQSDIAASRETVTTAEYDPLDKGE